MAEKSEDDIIEEEERKARLPRTARLSEMLYHWYYAQVKKGAIIDPWAFFFTLNTQRRKRRGFDERFDYDEGEMKQAYRRLKAAGYTKERIGQEIGASTGSNVFNMVMIAVGLVFFGAIGALLLGPLAGSAILALSGQKSLVGASAMAAMFFMCVPGPVIGAVAGYMVAKDSNDRRKRKMLEKLDELDRMP
jgi:hypothetical protein